MHTAFDDTAELAAREQLVSLFLPLAMTLEADHFRVFLAVCAEDGISLQKLGRFTGLGQSEVIRATSMLEAWQADESTGDNAPGGLLHSRMEIVKGYRRQSFLSGQGIALRDALNQAFGADNYAEPAFAFHQFVQQELLTQDWAAAPAATAQA